ncbi:transposase [Streptomyces sp. NPDC001635]
MHFAAQDCGPCPLRHRCTETANGKWGRRLTLPPREQQEALDARRQEQLTDEWQKRYHVRAGVDGTIAQAIRRTDIHRTRTAVVYASLGPTHMNLSALTQSGSRVLAGVHVDGRHVAPRAVVELRPVPNVVPARVWVTMSPALEPAERPNERPTRRRTVGAVRVSLRPGFVTAVQPAVRTDPALAGELGMLGWCDRYRRRAGGSGQNGCQREGEARDGGTDTHVHSRGTTAPSRQCQ